MHSVAADLLESKQRPLRQSSIQTAPVPSQQFTMPVLAASSSTLLPPREPRLALLQEVGDALAEVLGVAADRLLAVGDHGRLRQRLEHRLVHLALDDARGARRGEVGDAGGARL